MRIRLNPKSISELEDVMRGLGEVNPTHVVQQLISKFHKSLPVVKSK